MISISCHSSVLGLGSSSLGKLPISVVLTSPMRLQDLDRFTLATTNPYRNDIRFVTGFDPEEQNHKHPIVSPCPQIQQTPCGNPLHSHECMGTDCSCKYTLLRIEGSAGCIRDRGQSIVQNS
jgi:hypothetical protein